MTTPDRTPAKVQPVIQSERRAVHAVAPAYRWECPCQDPPVLLATCDPNGRVNIKVRDRYWHLFGFGQVQAICPRCAAEHILDVRWLHESLRGDPSQAAS